MSLRSEFTGTCHKVWGRLSLFRAESTGPVMEMCSWQRVGDATLRLPQPAEIKHKRCRETESPANCSTVVQCHCFRDHDYMIISHCPLTDLTSSTIFLSLNFIYDEATIYCSTWNILHVTYELSFTFAGVSVVSINKTDMTDKILDNKVIAAQRQVKS